MLAVDGEGRFAFEGGFAQRARGRALDMHVRSADHLDTVVAVTVPGEVTVRMERGLALSGSVVGPDGAPMDDVVVVIRKPGTESASAVVVSDAKGEFQASGLWGEFVFLYGHKGAYRGRTAARVGGTALLRLDEKMVSFRLNVRATDGGTLWRGLLRWDDPHPEKSAALLWSSTWTWTPGDRVQSSWVTVPADPGPADLTLDVPGYLPWRVDGHPLRGTESKEFDVALRPNPHAGSLTVRLEVPGGGALPRDEAPVYARLSRGQAVIRLATVDPEASRWEVTGLGPGAYDLSLRGPGRMADGLVPVTVPAGATAEVRVTLQPMGALEVAFEGAPRTGVTFQLLAGGSPVSAFEVGADRRQSASGERYPGDRFLTDTFAAVPGKDEVFRRRIEGMPPGPYEVVTAGQQRFPVTVVAGRTAEFRAVLGDR